MSCLLIVFNQRMAYTEELMIKLATLLKIVWVMEFDKATFKNQFFNIKIEAHLV